MTEQSLLLKCACVDRYFIVGTDFPAARVFDTATSSLVAVVELPRPSRAVSLAALTLTAVAIGRVDRHRRVCAEALVRHQNETLLDDNVVSYTAAVGLSNGTVILHDIRRDAPLAHVQVSERQQPIISLQLCGGFAFCLAANHALYALDLRDAAAGPCLQLRVHPDASSIAVTLVTGPEPATKGSMAGADATAPLHLRLLVAGPTTTLYELHAPIIPDAELSRGQGSDRQVIQATKVLSFPSQGTIAESAWVSDMALPPRSPGGAEVAASLPAVTASAQEGVVRVWDVQYRSLDLPSSANITAVNAGGAHTAVASTVVARCRRTLLCGQRILNVSVLADTASHARRGNYIMVTTLTGSLLLWSLGDALLPPIVELMPLKPDVVLVSTVPAGRMLFGALRLASSAPRRSSASANPLAALDVTILRGRFALPMFETRNIGDAVEDAAISDAPKTHRADLATLALGVAASNTNAVTVVEVPLNAANTASLAGHRDVHYLLQHSTDAATSSFVVMDTVWATHQQQVAAKATQTMTEAFRAPHLYHAKSIQDLPVTQATLEQRLQQVARQEATVARKRNALATATSADDGMRHADEDDPLQPSLDPNASAGSRSAVSAHALGLATVPLYQALHANDTSAVMDLLSISARSSAGMRATALSLQLPYCLQLLHVISERLGLCSRAVEKSEPAPTNGAVDETVPNTEEVDAGQEQPAKDTQVGPGSPKTAPEAGSGGDAAVRGGVASFSIRSSLLEWIDVIVHYRGSELLAVQREWNARQAALQRGESVEEADPLQLASPPKDFLAPLLHHYEALCSQYDKLAVLHGRLSIFKSVRPSQKNEFVNAPRRFLGSNLEMGRPAPPVINALATSRGSGKRHVPLAERSSVVDDDIIFPTMFKESRARSGHRVVRVRSKLEIQKKRRERQEKDLALLKRSRALAKAQLQRDQAPRSILDDDDSADRKRGGVGGVDPTDELMMAEMTGKDGAIDFDALEAMDLADSGSDESASEGEDGEGEESESDISATAGSAGATARAKGKKARKEAIITDAMLADSGEDDDGDDNDAGLDSSEAEFSSASDDEVRSDALEDNNTDSDEEDDDEESGTDVKIASASEDLDGDDDTAGDGSEDGGAEDGLGEDMRELLAHEEDNDDRTERRKMKKVRTD